MLPSWPSPCFLARFPDPHAFGSGSGNLDRWSSDIFKIQGLSLNQVCAPHPCTMKKPEREPSPDPWPCIVRSLNESIGDLKKLGEPSCKICAPNLCVVKKKKADCNLCAPGPCVMREEKVPVKVSRSSSVGSRCRHRSPSTSVSRSVTFEEVPWRL